MIVICFGTNHFNEYAASITYFLYCLNIIIVLQKDTTTFQNSDIATTRVRINKIMIIAQALMRSKITLLHVNTALYIRCNTVSTAD